MVVGLWVGMRLVVVLVVLVLAVGGVVVCGGSERYFICGDWVVEDVVVVENLTVIVDGNIVVGERGTLILRKFVVLPLQNQFITGFHSS